MSEVEAEFAVAGAIVVTLISAYTAYILQERSATNRLRQEVALRPYVDRVTALKTVYLSMVDCAEQLNRSITIMPQTIQEYQQKVGEPLDSFRKTLYRNSIWLSKVEPQIVEVLTTFNETALGLLNRIPNQLQAGVPLSAFPIPYDELVLKPVAASKVIADELGVNILEGQLADIFEKLKTGSSTASSTTITQAQQMSQSQNTEIDLLKVNLASDYRLGWVLAMTGGYLALIVGLLVAWYQKFGSGDPVVYYTGIALIGGLLLAMLVTQELIPYKNWFNQIDGWMKLIEANKRIPDVRELVRLKDRLQSTGHLVLIFLVVLDFYYTIASTYDKVLLFLGFLIVGVLVVLLTHGGIGTLKKERRIAPGI